MPKLDLTTARAIRLNVGGTPRDALAVKGAGFAWDMPLLDWRVGEALPAGSTFSRASSATYVDANGAIQTAAAGVMRDGHYVNGERTVRLEGARTNRSLRSVLFNGTSPSKGGDAASVISVVNDAAELAVAGLSAIVSDSMVVRLDNSAGATAAYWSVGGGNASLSPHAMSVWVRGGSGSLSWAGLGYPTSGFVAQTAYRRHAVGPFTPTVAGGVIRVIADPGQVIYAVLPQLEEGSFASSYIPTTGAAVTRAADALTFPFPHAPQEMTVYVRHVETGAAHNNAGGVLWAAGGVPSRLQMQGANGVYSLVHNTGASANSRSYAAPPLGALHEAASILFTNGQINVEHATNGGASKMVTGSPAIGLAGAWAVGQFSPGSVNGGAPGAGAFTHVLVMPGVRTLAAMRDPAGVAP